MSGRFGFRAATKPGGCRADYGQVNSLSRGARGRCLLGLMKTRAEAKRGAERKKEDANEKTKADSGSWKTPGPAQGGGARLAEWSPGAAARRGYERAVEEWWWL
jgi:hypothetical protein